MKKKKVGLALGAGGARGLAHIGVLKVLVENNIKIDYIIGSSMGSVIGAAYALGMSPAEMEEIAKKHSRKRDMVRFIDLINPKKAIIKGKKVDDFLTKLYNNKNFNDTNIPLRVLATDLASGKEVVFKKGSIAEAVQASVSVPGIFPPKVIGNMYLVDGGVVNPTPVTNVQAMGADIVIGVDFLMRKNLRIVNPSTIDTLVRTFEIIRAQSVKASLYGQNKNIVMITPDTRSTTESFQFNRLDEFIRSGEKATNKALPRILKALE